jgi:predicted metal-dependent phosphoesterase TrpH
MKCDLHVHSIHSGNCTIPFLNRFCRESYSDPEQVYKTLKRKGMGLVTLTDHDSIDGAECLRHYPDFFLSEEVTCRMPSGTSVHVGVYDLSERQHIEIQRRRNDLPSLLAYLSEARLFFAVNHIFSSLTGDRRLDDFNWFAEYFPAFEVLNGQMLPFHNQSAWQLAQRMGKVGIGGSDAHAIASVGTAYTEVPNARCPGDFLRGLREGRGVAAGGHGSYFKLTRDIFSITRGMICERPWTALLATLTPLIPLATLATLIDETRFARHWSMCVHAEIPARSHESQFPFTTSIAERFA